MGVFLKWWYPQIIHFKRVFHYKPSILGYPYFWKHPYLQNIKLWSSSMIVILDMELQSCRQSFISNWVVKSLFASKESKFWQLLIWVLAMIFPNSRKKSLRSIPESPLFLADLVTQLFKLKVLDFSCPAVELHSNPNEPKPSFKAFKKQQKNKLSSNLNLQNVANHSNILEDNKHTTFDYLIL